VPSEAWSDIRAAELIYVLPHGALNRLPFETLVSSRSELSPGSLLDRRGPARRLQLFRLGPALGPAAPR